MTLALNQRERFVNPDGTLTTMAMRYLSSRINATQDDPLIQGAALSQDAPEVFQKPAHAALITKFLLSPTAANLAAALAAADKTGTGALVFGTAPTLSALSVNSGLIGYVAGAGGTATQLVDKSTAVTVNEPSGQITMNNAALAAGAVVRFTVNNSLVTATDVPVIAIKSSVTASAYRAWVESVAAGLFRVCVENRSAGSESDAVVLNFAVIKGATT